MKLLDAALVALVAHGAGVFDDNLARWCRVNNVSRATAYRHLKRIRERGRWEPDSTRPRTRAGHATPLEVEAEVVRLRRELAEQPGEEVGADNVRYYLSQLALLDGWAERGWVVPSRATIHKIMKRHGLVRPEPAKRPRSSYRRFVYARPRDCYQIDATEVRLGAGKAVVVEVLDDCSRVLVATHAADSETADAVIAAVQRAFDDYGVPALVLSDNGAAFTSRFTKGGTSRFTRHVRTAGARLIHSSPYHPQTCGKVERHHRTFKAWLAQQPSPSTLTELQQLCDRYQRWYNQQRRHSAANQPPLRTWDSAPELGGPVKLPVQQDARVSVHRLDQQGRLSVGPTKISVDRARAAQPVTVLHDGDHITVYLEDGTPLGHLHIDHASPAQRLVPAA
jgi:putative transposase